jgi:hypothetical protein
VIFAQAFLDERPNPADPPRDNGQVISSRDLEDVLKVLIAAQVADVLNKQMTGGVDRVLASIPVPAEPVSKRLLGVLDARLDAHRAKKAKRLRLCAAERARAHWRSRHTDQADSPRHLACGTPIEVRWYCPSTDAL